MTNLDIILKSRDITLPTMVHLVKALVFPVVMYGCESWTIKKAECWRIDGFELWCWRRLLRAPWTARWSNQSILKEISTEYSLERLLLRLKLPIFWPPDVKIWHIWKDPDAGKDWGKEEKGMTEEEMFGWHSQHNWHEFEWIPGVDNGQGGLTCCSSLVRKELDTTEWLNWTDIVQENSIRIILCLYNISSEQGQKICACIKVSFSMAPLILILNLKCPFEMPLETGKNNKSKTLKYTKFI